MNKMIALGVALMALSAAGQAAAHARLIASEPRREAAVPAPKALRLTFSERIVAKTSSVTVTGPKGAVAVGPIAVDHKNPKLVVAKLPALSAGDYKVDWTMTTEDTHTMRGDYTFKVK